MYRFFPVPKLNSINQMFLSDLCPVPEIANGRILIDGTKEEGFLFGEVLCDPGYHLVGFSKTLKCREGVWSQRVMPMCGESIISCEYSYILDILEVFIGIGKIIRNAVFRYLSLNSLALFGHQQIEKESKLFCNYRGLILQQSAIILVLVQGKGAAAII